MAPGGPAGWSRSIAPSSTATSAASAVTSFVTEAQPDTCPTGPREATTPAGVTTATAAAGEGQSSIWRRASTGRDTSRVERRLISSGSPFEPLYGYSRAVVAGDRVHVAGTVASMPGGAAPLADAAAQARRCWEIIGAALTEAGCGLADVVRSRVYLTRLEDFDAVGRVHGELFGAEIRPANTTVVVAALVDPRYLVEIEAEAHLPRSGRGQGAVRLPC